MSFKTGDDTVTKSEFDSKGWTAYAIKSHILYLSCSNVMKTCKEIGQNVRLCQYCTYSNSLKLPQWPEMLFADNSLKLVNRQSNSIIEFNAFDALKLVDAEHDMVKVSASEEWLTARKDCPFVKNVMNPFDWTFTTDYSGTVTNFKVETTEERIDLNKLKIREPILFYEEIVLFDDELADHGASSLSIKFRMMPSGWFCLLRFFLRVDHLLFRVIDTRFRWEQSKAYVLREHIVLEKQWNQLSDGQRSLALDPNALVPFLDTKKLVCEKLIFSEDP